MEEGKVPQQEQVAEDLPEDAGTERISLGRKARLVILLLVLAGVVTATVMLKKQQDKLIAEREQGLAKATENLRQAIAKVDPSEPMMRQQEKLNSARSLYESARTRFGTEVQEVNRLGVAVFYADGQLTEAVRLFNELSEPYLSEVVEEIGEADGLKAREAIAPFLLLLVKAEAARAEIHPAGTQYLRGCGFLWGVGRDITASANNDKEKALLLCRWFARHVLPTGADVLPSDPYAVTLLGRASASQMAWTYAELARQVGLRAHVVVMPRSEPQDETGYLVQVYPAGDDPFVVNPHWGIPVTDPGSGELLSLSSLAERPERYAALVALAGEESPYGAEEFRQAELKVAIHPYAVFLRFLVFDRVLSVLRSCPRVAFDFASLPQGEGIHLWEACVNILTDMATQQYVKQSTMARKGLQITQQARIMQLQGFSKGAAYLYKKQRTDLKKTLSQAEIEEAAALLRETIDNVSWFGAISAYDSRALEEAENELRTYLKEYPQGRWLTLAKVTLADLLSEKGERAAAEQLWKDLPRARRLYGALHLKGLFPMPAAAQEPGAEQPEGPSSQAGSP